MLTSGLSAVSVLRVCLFVKATYFSYVVVVIVVVVVVVVVLLLLLLLIYTCCCFWWCFWRGSASGAGAIKWYGCECISACWRWG